MKIFAPIGLLLGLAVSSAAVARDFPEALFAATPSNLAGTEPVAALPALPGSSLDRVLPRARDAVTAVRPALDAPAVDAGNPVGREPPGTPRALLHDHVGMPGAPVPVRKPRAVLSWQSLLPGSIQ